MVRVNLYSFPVNRYYEPLDVTNLIQRCLVAKIYVHRELFPARWLREAKYQYYVEFKTKAEAQAFKVKYLCHQ